MFGFFVREFDFQEDIERFRFGVQAAGELDGVDRLDDVEQFGGAFGLVRLQVTDQMKARAGKRTDQGSFRFELLDIIFSEVAEAEGVGFRNGRGGEDFRHRDKSDLGTGTAGAGAGVLDSFFDTGEIFCQHSYSSYV
mgnify:CR=1 FL=1